MIWRSTVEKATRRKSVTSTKFLWGNIRNRPIKIEDQCPMQNRIVAWYFCVWNLNRSLSGPERILNQLYWVLATRERGVELVTERPGGNCEVLDGSMEYSHVTSKDDGTCHQFFSILVDRVAPLRWPHVWCKKRLVSVKVTSTMEVSLSHVESSKASDQVDDRWLARVRFVGRIWWRTNWVALPADLKQI